MSPDEPTPHPRLVVTHDPAKTEAITWLVCLVVGLAFLTYFLSGADPFGDREMLTAFRVGFGCASGFFAIQIVRKMSARKRDLRVYAVEDGDLECRSGDGILWREPTGTYRCIRWHQERRSHVTNRGAVSYTLEVLTLEHPNPERSLEIFAHQTSSKLEAHAKRWSDGLGLAIVRTT